MFGKFAAKYDGEHIDLKFDYMGIEIVGILIGSFKVKYGLINAPHNAIRSRYLRNYLRYRQISFRFFVQEMEMPRKLMKPFPLQSINGMMIIMKFPTDCLLD